MLAKSKREILRRAAGRCEIGGEYIPQGEAVERHHVFPAKGLGLPWSDSAEAGVATCHDHHAYVQTHPLSPEQLGCEAAAVARLERRLAAEGGYFDDTLPSTYKRAALLIVGELEKLGVNP